MQMPFSFPGFPRWRTALVVLIIVGTAAYLLLGRGGDFGATLTVISGDFREQVSVSGTVVATQSVALGFAANGRIAGTHVIVGQHVARGTILAEIENGDMKAALAQKEAALASLLSGTRTEQIAVTAASVASNRDKLIDALRTAYTVSDDAIHNKADTLFSNPRSNPWLAFTVANASLKNAVEQDRADIDALFTDWAALLAAVTPENATATADRSVKYLGQVTTLLADANAAINQAVSDQTTTATTLSSYATTIATARSSVNTASAALTNAMSALTDAEKTLALNQAGPIASNIASAEAEVRSARALLEKTRVIAPFDGTVTRMDAKVGEIVSPSTSEISMQSDGIFEIETYVPEVTIARVAVGNPATTTLDAYGSSVEFAATVISVDPAETMKDGVPTYKTTLSFLAADSRIRSGMTANVVIETGMLHDAVVIPAGAVGSKQGMSYVSIVDQGKLLERAVTTGPSPMLGQAHILEGLAEGDIILLTPSL